MKNTTISYMIIFLSFSVFISNCSTIQFSEYDGFWEYMKGKPGLQNAKDASKKDAKGIVFGERHPYYLWFRTPEIIFNPQGGVYYPDMITEYDGKLYDTRDLSTIKDKEERKQILIYRNGLFTGMDDGLVDYTLQYRELIDPAGQLKHAIQKCILLPILYPLVLVYYGKIFIYPLHDIAKTVMIPVAGVYYTVQAFEDDEEEE